ncbi:MAG: M48 family metalloprotease [Candidatus Kapabacteria bacterium]|nr:M48 family metalloprotease [Candidatus Kapabacteria bacterium]
MTFGSNIKKENRKPLQFKSIIAILFFCVFSSSLYSENVLKESQIKEVFDKIYYKVKSELKLPYKITFEYIEDEKINAYACPNEKKEGDFKVIITSGLMENIVKDNIDGLALIIGHEIAHITQNHLEPYTKKVTQYKDMIFTRENEYEADTIGLKYALRAGFSATKGLNLIHNFIKLNLNYSSFEGLSSDHPSWSERLEYLEKEKSKLWRSMAAFENGVYFLEIEHYIPAEFCFRAVVREFPDCYEAFANLGYTLLMQYCDALDVNNLKKYNLGMIITGAFFKRPMSLTASVRGINEELWWDAVGQLKEALRLKPDLAIVNANLGLAYLLHPSGKDLKNSTRYFENALKLIEEDTTIDNISKSIIYINAGVSNLADGDVESCMKKFDYAEQLSSLYYARYPINTRNNDNYISACLNYNRAFLMSNELKPDLNKIKKLLESFLLNSNKTSIWWEIGRERYNKLCKELQVKPSQKIEKRRDFFFKPVVGLNIRNVGYVGLSDRRDIFLDKFKKNTLMSTTIASGTNLELLSSEEYGLEFLVSEMILSIFLKKETSPQVTLETSGLTGKKFNIYVGMSINEFEKVIDVEKDNFRFDKILSNSTDYRYYYNLGLAVRLNKKENKVSEIVIIQLPYKMEEML